MPVTLPSLLPSSSVTSVTKNLHPSFFSIRNYELFPCYIVLGKLVQHPLARCLTGALTEPCGIVLYKNTDWPWPLTELNRHTSLSYYFCPVVWQLINFGLFVRKGKQ